MNEFKIHRGGLPVGLFLAAIVTMVLFIALPLLTQMQRSFNPGEKIQGTLIRTEKPKAVPDESRDEPKKQEMKQQETKKEVKQTRRVQPKFDVPKMSLGGSDSGLGGVQIAQDTNFQVSDSLFMSAFNLNEVDTPPRPVKTFKPTYPYLARRDNITGKIFIKFVVDADGNPQEAEVLRAEPPEVQDMFADAALKALMRYKFKPAVKNGKNVLCIAVQPISFTLD